MKKTKQKAELNKSKAYIPFCFLLFLAQMLTASAFAAEDLLNKINEAYISENNSVIINIKNKSNLEIQEIKKLSPQNYKIYFNNADLSFNLDKKIDNENLSANFKELKNNTVELSLNFKTNDVAQIQSRTILDGLAYEIYSQSIPETKISKSKVTTDLLAFATEDSTINNFAGFDTSLGTDTEQHHLEISKNDKLLIFSTAKPNAEEFLSNLDKTTVNSLIQSPEFMKRTFEKIDSVTLSHIGDSLNQKGLIEQAYKAYQEALKLDESNSQAHLGIAQTSNNSEEKIINLLATVDSKNLIAIGEDWFASGIKNLDSKLIAQSFIPFQFAILKEPKNPEMRFAYASILEKAGFDFYAESSKRYLEAAALAKELYQKGDLKNENLMRKSAESLIRTIVYLGDQEKAIKYCNSYLNLGFDRFLDGRPVLALVKEIRFNRNPFLKG